MTRAEFDPARRADFVLTALVDPIPSWITLPRDAGDLPEKRELKRL